jgi:hypothetical protein
MGRTTFVLDDDVLKTLKQRAAEEGLPVQSLANDLLRAALFRKNVESYRLRLKGWKATPRAGVDVLDRDSLFDAMEER